jgi:hypothetical protein
MDGRGTRRVGGRRRPRAAAAGLLPLAACLALTSLGPASASGEERPVNNRAAGPAVASESVARLVISPARIRLDGKNRRQQLLVTAVLTHGGPLDVTQQCQLDVASSAVQLVNTALIGVHDGRTQLTARLGSQTATAEIVVSDFADYPAVHFENDILPLFSKLACNSGGCHGKQGGQNGFQLSVFGFDPRADFNAIVKEARGRRVFVRDPDHSLIVRKATGQMPHGGGARTGIDSQDCELLRQWILQGLQWGDPSAPTLQAIRVEPTERILPMQADQQLLVTACYSDGQERDVTSWASYTSNAEFIADVQRDGRAMTGSRPGEAAITVNYMGQIGTVRILVPRAATAGIGPVPDGLGPIDGLGWQKLQKLGIPASPPCDDATFMRRVYLQTLGVLPAPDDVRRFLDDTAPDKRRRLIDDVLQRPEYADYWALKWADILMVNKETLGSRGAYELHQWLRAQFAENRPYDQWARELLTASGNSGKNGAVNYFRAAATPEDLTRTFSQAFLGVRMDCAQCHHHPFEKWAQTDFYGLTGFFTGLQKKAVGDGRELVFHAGYRPATLPLTGEHVATRFLEGPPLDAQQLAGDPRQVLADWLTDPQNPYFARLVANRLWKHFLGRGLIEPEDDLRTTNPASNEPLLAYLSQQVVASNYDLQAVMRQIMNSDVYQRSSVTLPTNVDDDQNFSHYLVRRLPAEVLLDVISQATGSAEAFPGMPRGTRASQLWDNRMPSYFLEIFGRSERESPCACGKSDEPTMSQALHLMNAPEIEAKIQDPAGRAASLIQQGLRQPEIVEQLTLATLGRLPGEHELSLARKLFASRPLQTAAEDYLWTLLNSYEFLFVH